MAETATTYTVPEHYVLQFTGNVRAALQRMGGKLDGMVTSSSYSGEKAQIVDFLGPVSFRRIDTVYQDTQFTEAEHTQRWIAAEDYVVAIPVDKIDRLRMIYDPTSPYVERVREAAARLKDDIIMSAFFATARTGKLGATLTAFPTRDIIAYGGTRMSVAKLRAARKLLKQRFVDLRAEQPMIAMTAEQTDDLLGELPVNSVDYNTVKPLTSGEVAGFMGFTFVPIEQIIPATTISSQLVRLCPVWVKSGMHYGDWDAFSVDIDKRPDKNNMTQIMARMSAGATRVEEGRVLQLQCQES